MTTEDQKTIDTLLELKQLLQTENEHLYQQYNHLMIRNHKLMKRIDDQQMLNDRLQARIEGLELTIDRLRQRYDDSSVQDSKFPGLKLSGASTLSNEGTLNVERNNIDIKQLISRWGSLAGPGTRGIKNMPTKKRQMQILSLLYQNQKMPGMQLFIACGINGVSGARYISALKKFGLIAFSGYRKDGFYFLTDKGKEFIEAT